MLNQSETSEDQSLQFSLNLRDEINKYLIYWPWFLLSLGICLLYITIKLNFTRENYSTSSTIQILNTEGRERESQLATFKDLGIDVRSNNVVEDEIEIITSNRLITETIKHLNLNVNYFTDENSVTNYLDNSLGTNFNFYKKELYKDQPINVNFLSSKDSLYNSSAEFIISIKSGDEYFFKDLTTGIEKNHVFGDKIQTSIGEIIITPNFDLSSNTIPPKVKMEVLPLEAVVAYYEANLNIEQTSEFSSVVNLTMEGTSTEKSEDFLNSLVDRYNNEAIEAKNIKSEETAEFVETRLQKISEELSSVDVTAERFKQRNRLSDMANETGMNLQSGREVENQIVDASTQLLMVQSVKDFMTKQDNNELIPLNLGFADNTVNEISKKYNDLLLEKQRLLKSSTEKNPVVQNLNDQINIVKQTLNESLSSLENTKRISLNALTQQNSTINSKIYSAPRKERQYRDIQRQQQIKEALFLYILQKREESAITLGASSPPSRVVDEAESQNKPVSPKKPVAYLGAFIFGLFFPFSVIYLKNVLDTKVHTKEDLEKILSIPILGDIPKLSTKKPYLIANNDQSSAAEAFRILRTNLSFLLTKTNNKGKTIFITSTIAHEGKSLIASNLASSLALTGNKTLIIGMDIRAPKLKPYLGIRGNKGITNYIIDDKLSVNDITLEIPKVPNLYLISSGDIPPNPAELMLHERVKLLFDSVKEEYDYIIVDTAASSVVTDTMLLQQHADAFVYVVRANYLDKRRLKYIQSIYKSNRLPNMALLLNGVDHKKSYGYGYGYGYGQEYERSKAPWWKLKLNL